MLRRSVLAMLAALPAAAAAACGGGAPAQTGATTTAAPPKTSGAKRGLFVNMTSDDRHRADMAMNFALGQQGLGHPVTVFLNDRGVHVGVGANKDKFPEAAEKLAKLLAAGATILACPMCTKHFGIDPSNYVKGIEMTSPDKNAAKLWEDGTVSMSW